MSLCLGLASLAQQIALALPMLMHVESDAWKKTLTSCSPGQAELQCPAPQTIMYVF